MIQRKRNQRTEIARKVEEVKSKEEILIVLEVMMKKVVRAIEVEIGEWIMIRAVKIIILKVVG